MTNRLFHRLAIALLAIGPICTSAAAEPAAAPTPQNVSCEPQSELGEIREVNCPILGSGEIRRFRFTVTFLGGHDDTMAALKATEDGHPIDCDQGSKTRLMGEDGEVSLFCTLSLKHDPGSAHVLGFTATWTHAQYKDFEIISD
jgi:hypothetical protein